MNARELGGARAVAGFALAESLRRRVFTIVLALTVAFLVLYGLGVEFAFKALEEEGLAGGELFDERTLVGSTIFGLAMFATLFLGAVLAIFLTIGVVRGDAERGLLQPLVVRPLGRPTMLIARWAGAAGAAAVYVLVVYGIALLLTSTLGDWTPDAKLAPGLALAFAVVILAAVSVLVSVFATSTAQGIAVFMLFGAGLVAGLLGQIGEAIDSSTLVDVAEASAYVLPFEALYQHGLYLLTAQTSGLTSAVVELGPFGGAQEAGGLFWLYALGFCAAIVALAIAAFGRRDL